MQFKGNLYLEVKDTVTGKVKKTISAKNTGTFLGNWNPFVDENFLGILTEPLTETFGDSTTLVDSSTVEGIVVVTYGFERGENLHYSHSSDDKSYLEINISWSPDNPTTIYGLYTRFKPDYNSYNWFVTSIIQLEDPLTVQPTDTLSGKYRIDFYSDIESRIQIVKGEYVDDGALPYKVRSYRNDIDKNYYEEVSELDNWCFWREVRPDLNYKTNQLTRLFKHTTEADDWEEDYVVGTINSTGSLELQYDDTTAIDSSSILVEGGYWTFYTRYSQTGGIGTAHYRPYFKVSRWCNTASGLILILDKKIKIYSKDGKIEWSNQNGAKIEEIFPNSLSVCPYDVDKLLVMYQNKIELINWYQFEKKVAATPPSGNYFKNGKWSYGIFYDMQSHYLFVYSATNKWLLYEEDGDTGTFNFVKEITSMSSIDIPGNISWPYCMCYSGKIFNLSTDSFVGSGEDSAYFPNISQITIGNKMFLKTDYKIIIFDKNTETITSTSNRDYPTYILSRQSPEFSLLSHFENNWYSQKYYAVATGENSWKFYPTVYWLHWFEFGEEEPFGALDTKVATTEWRTIDGGLRYRHSAGPTEPSFVENEKFSITSSETGLYSDKLQKHSVSWVKIYGSKGVGERIKGGSDWVVRNYYNNLPEEQKIYYSENFPENCCIDSTAVLQDIEEADSTSNVYIYVDGHDSRDSYFFASITKDNEKWVVKWYITPVDLNEVVNLGTKWVTNKLVLPFPHSCGTWEPKIYIWKSDKDFIDEVDSIGMCVSDKIYELWKENMDKFYIILAKSSYWPFGSPRYIDGKVLINIL